MIDFFDQFKFKCTSCGVPIFYADLLDSKGIYCWPCWNHRVRSKIKQIKTKEIEKSNKNQNNQNT